MWIEVNGDMYFFGNGGVISVKVDSSGAVCLITQSKQQFIVNESYESIKKKIEEGSQTMFILPSQKPLIYG